MIAVIFNLWFCYCRDTSKDRSFINNFHYFVLITSFLWLFLITYTLLSNFDTENKVFYYLALFNTNICYLVISFYRINIEYVKIVLAQGPTNSRFVNCFLFLFGFYKKPKFKEIKKVLNVKFVESGHINDTNETIFSVIKN